jgi:transcriptional regulator with XRE-family HTH domain
MPPEADIPVGEIIRRHRLRILLTQEELARRAGLSPRALSNIECGHTIRPYSRSLRLLADALQLSEESRSELATAANVTLFRAAHQARGRISGRPATQPP